MKFKLKMLRSKKPCWANITFHALTRFITRWAPHLSTDEAEEELYTLLNSAKAAGKTPLGDTMYVSGLRPEIRFVIKDTNVCVTVLPPGDTNFVDLESELEMLALEDEERRQAIQFEIDEVEKQIQSLNEEKVELLAPLEDRLRVISEKTHQAKNKLYLLKKKFEEGLISSN